MNIERVYRRIHTLILLRLSFLQRRSWVGCWRRAGRRYRPKSGSFRVAKPSVASSPPNPTKRAVKVHVLIIPHVGHLDAAVWRTELLCHVKALFLNVIVFQCYKSCWNVLFTSTTKIHRTQFFLSSTTLVSGYMMWIGTWAVLPAFHLLHSSIDVVVVQ